MWPLTRVAPELLDRYVATSLNGRRFRGCHQLNAAGARTSGPLGRGPSIRDRRQQLRATARDSEAQECARAITTRGRVELMVEVLEPQELAV